MAIELSDSDTELPYIGLSLMSTPLDVHAISSDSETEDLLPGPSLAQRLKSKPEGHHVNEQIEAPPAKKLCLFESQSKEDKKKERESQKKKKEEEKSLLRQQREEKKEQLEYEKAKKRMLQQASRSAKPGECLKSMLVMVSPGVIAPPMGILLDTLEKANLRYVVQSQVIEDIVTFWREVTDVKENNGKQLTTEQHEVMETEVLHFLTLSDFLSTVCQYHQQKKGLRVGDPGAKPALNELHKKVSRCLPGHQVTFVVLHLKEYFNLQKCSKQRNFKKQVTGKAACGSRKGKVSFADCPDVTHLEVEEALLDLQMREGGIVRFVESAEDACTLVKQFTKAVAEKPFKRDRLNGDLATLVNANASARVTKEGRGLLALWRQQIQQFRNVTAEVANAIIAEYPSPRSLCQAYKSCENQMKAEKLLQDILVRRGAGVIATSRRIGKELSRKMYLLMTSDDPELII